MTTRPPPPGRPPRLETYRPAEERSGPPRPAPTLPQPGLPPPGYPRQAHAPAPHFPAPPMAPPRREPGFGPPPPGARPAPPQRSGLGSAVRYGVLGLIAMAAGAAAFVIATLPAGFVRAHVAAAVKKSTGRDLVMAGPASFTLYPKLAISLADVSLSGAPGFEGTQPLVTMKALDLSVALWPLVRREVRINALVMREPVFHLVVDGNGRRSWDFADAGERRGWTRLAKAEGTASDASPAPAAAPQSDNGERPKVSGLTLDDVRIDNGTVHYENKQSGSVADISAVNVKMALAALAQPLNAEGSLVWNGETVRFDGALASLADVIADRPAKLKVKVGAAALTATFDGSAHLKDGLRAEGILSANSDSARALARWLADEPPPSAGFGPLTAKGLLVSAPDRLSFTTAEIVLDRTTARGDIHLDTRGARPLVTANLALSELDLNTYARSGEAKPAKAKKAAKAAAGPGKEGKAQSIEELIEQTAPAGPRVKGFTRREGWSEEALDLEGLGSLDADAKLAVGKLTVGTIRLEESDLTLALRNRVLTTNLNRVRLYEGTGSGLIKLDGTADKTAGLDADLVLEGIEAQPLLKDTAEVDRLTGKGRLRLKLAGRGASEREIVETLGGTVELAFHDGAIVGVNIPEMIRNLRKGNLGGLDAKPTDKTDFSEMTSTWTVKDGVAENQDLKLVSPLLRISGAGRVSLPAREVDYLLKPKVVASLAGQGGGTEELAGLEIPVRVHGPWERPKYTPDLGAALKDPDKAVETVKEIGKKLKGKKTEEIVNDLLGGDSGSGESTKAKGKKLLEQFLNKN